MFVVCEGVVAGSVRVPLGITPLFWQNGGIYWEPRRLAFMWTAASLMVLCSLELFLYKFYVRYRIIVGWGLHNHDCYHSFLSKSWEVEKKKPGWFVFCLFTIFFSCNFNTFYFCLHFTINSFKNYLKIQLLFLRTSIF